MCVTSFVPNRIELDMNFILIYRFLSKNIYEALVRQHCIFLYFGVFYFSTFYISLSILHISLQEVVSKNIYEFAKLGKLAHLVTVATLVGRANLTISLNVQINLKVRFS